MKVVLQYTKCLNDEKIVSTILAKENIKILKYHSSVFDIEPKMTIEISNYDKLNKLLVQLNDATSYGVHFVKLKKSYFKKRKEEF